MSVRSLKKSGVEGKKSMSRCEKGFSQFSENTREILRQFIGDICLSK